MGEYYDYNLKPSPISLEPWPLSSDARSMRELKDLIISLRVENSDGTDFILESKLFNLLTRETIKKGCKLYTSPAHFREIVDTIFKGARKLFAILVVIGYPELIIDFFKSDQFQSSYLDHRLPIRTETLLLIVSELRAKEFHQQQWEFCPLNISKSGIWCHLEPHVILPFKNNKFLAQGGFGNVFDVEIEDEYHGLGRIGTMTTPGILNLVRKEMLPHTRDHESELQNLSLLKLLNHPNIICLLSSYTYRDCHNLLFPKASGGDLSDFLNCERPLLFERDKTFLIALTGLASVIHKVHSFTVREFDISLIGCHHDLKPKNVLVDGDRFLLSDFGLSRFKLESDGSKTMYRTRNGYEIAPECQDLEGTQEKHIVHRSSDIWSFGCIATYILIYMKKGSRGIKDFKDARKFIKDRETLYYFHRGNEVNYGMLNWLLKLEFECTTGERMLLQLIRKIFVLCPNKRPVTGDIVAVLQFTTLCFLVRAIMSRFSALRESYSIDLPMIEFLIEEKRFLSWQWSLGLIDDSLAPVEDYKQLLDCDDFESTVAALINWQQVLDAFSPSSENVRCRLILPIRQLNSSLLALLQSNARISANSFLETKLLSTESPDFLDNLSQFVPIQGLDIMLETKQKTLLSLTGELSFKTDWEKHYACDIWHGIHHNKSIDDIQYCAQESVLVEWKDYEDPVRRELIKPRIKDIASLLCSIPLVSQLRILHCQGYCHNPNRRAFGLLYSFPQGNRIQTLGSFLAKFHSSQYLPDLGTRLRLAYSLASAVLAFHQVSWLHKNLSASNIVFLCSSAITDNHKLLLSVLENPYIIGFMHSRSNHVTSFTEGPAPNSTDKDYSHPDYLSNDQRFEPLFDYYSLGLILFEIGVWRPLHKMTEKKGSPTEMLVKLRESWTPVMRLRAGAAYSECVQRCLDGTMQSQPLELGGRNGNGPADRSLAVYLKFSKLVVQELHRLAECNL